MSASFSPRNDAAGASSSAAGSTLMWTRDGPVLKMEDAVVETVVTHTTRTTTSFAPIPLPRIPAPKAIPLPYYLSHEEYPLAHEPTPEDLRVLALNLGGRRVLVQEDGKPIADGGAVPGESTGPGWRRSFPSDNYRDGVGFAKYLSKAKGKERKRPHELSPVTPCGDGHMGEGVLPTPIEGTNSFVRQSSPPRKKPRPTSDNTTDGGADQLMTPLSPSSADDNANTTVQPSLGSGLETATLLSLPAMIDHFEQLPDKMQQHVLMHLFRRSRMPTIQRISAFASTALKRDFISLLPHEISVQILHNLDTKSLTRASRVCRRWRKMIDSDRSVWRTRLVQEGMWYGHGVEEEEEKQIRRRVEALDSRAQSRRLSKAGTPSEDEPMPLIGEVQPPADDRPTPLKHVCRRRYVDQRGWLKKKPTHTSFTGHGTNVVTCLQFDHDKIVSASDDHSIYVYNTRNGQLRKRLGGHEGGVWALEFKGDTLVTGSTDRSVRIWDLESCSQTHLFLGHTSTVRCLQIVEPVYDEATGEYQPPFPVVITGSRDTSLRVWKLPKKGEPWTGAKNIPPEQNPYHLMHLEGHTEAVRAVAAHGRICASASYDKNVRIWDIVKGTCLHVLSGHENKVYSITFDRFRNRVISGSLDNTVKIWDIATGTCLHTLTGHSALVGLLGSSPNYYVSAAADASLRVWDANKPELKHVLSSHAAAITCFQHDEGKVVSGSEGTLKLWDMRTGQVVRDLIIGLSSVWQVAFHKNLLVSASHRGGNTMFDVFDFGKNSDPIDDEKLDSLCRPPWERGDPREPQAYQTNSVDADDDVIFFDDPSSSSPDATPDTTASLEIHTAAHNRLADLVAGRSRVASVAPEGSRSSNRLSRAVHWPKGLDQRRNKSEPRDEMRGQSEPIESVFGDSIWDDAPVASGSGSGRRGESSSSGSRSEGSLRTRSAGGSGSGSGSGSGTRSGARTGSGSTARPSSSSSSGSSRNRSTRSATRNASASGSGSRLAVNVDLVNLVDVESDAEQDDEDMVDSMELEDD